MPTFALIVVSNIAIALVAVALVAIAYTKSNMTRCFHFQLALAVQSNWGD